MKKVVILLALYSGALSAAENTNILKIFEHFTLASAAASKCIKLDKDELTSFLANHRMVTGFAFQEIQKRKPNITKEQVKGLMQEGSRKATQAVHSTIEKEGCDSPKIQDLIKRFHAQARWKP